MNEENITRLSIDEINQSQSLTDWLKVEKMTPEAIEALAQDNSDCQPTDDDFWDNAKVVKPQNDRMDDMTKLRWYMNISQQHAELMPQIMPGLANKEVITSLEATLVDYEKLLQAGVPNYPFYTIQDVKSQIADVLELKARTYESLSNMESAKIHYKRAIEAYENNDEQAKAQSCRDNLAQLINKTHGNVEVEIRRINNCLAKLPPNTLEHTQKLIELAELYSTNGDDYEADRLLKKAEEELKGLNPNPSGIDLATALTQSLQKIQSGQPTEGKTQIEALISIRSLYRRFYLCQAQIFRDRGNIEEAKEKMKMVEQMDSPQLNRDFSAQMLNSLNSLFKELD